MLSVIPIWLASNWRIVVSLFTGVAICWPVASCQGKREATIANNAKVELAAEQVKRAAAQAELAATLADMTRVAKTKEEAQEIKELIVEKASDDAAGPGMDAWIKRLRENAAKN